MLIPQDLFCQNYINSFPWGVIGLFEKLEVHLNLKNNPAKTTPPSSRTKYSNKRLQFSLSLQLSVKRFCQPICNNPIYPVIKSRCGVIKGVVYFL